MKTFLTIVALTTATVLVGCYTTSGTIPPSEAQASKSNLRLPYLSSVEMPEEINEGNVLEITIHGSFPDPSWFYYRTDTKIINPDESSSERTTPNDGSGNRIELFLWGKQNPEAGDVITVLVDFTQTERISDLKEGQYTVIIHGETENIEKPLMIRAKQ